jgi:hypothetical protein
MKSLSYISFKKSKEEEEESMEKKKKQVQWNRQCIVHFATLGSGRYCPDLILHEAAMVRELDKQSSYECFQL